MGPPLGQLKGRRDMPFVQQHTLANVTEGFFIWKMFVVCSVKISRIWIHLEEICKVRAVAISSW